MVLVNADPFDAPLGTAALTVGTTSVYVLPRMVELSPGADGQPAFASVDDIRAGARVEAVGFGEGRRLIAAALRPTREPAGGGVDQPLWPMLLLFPLTAALVAAGLLIAEGLTTRNWIRMLERTTLGGVLAALFALLALVPAGLAWQISSRILAAEAAKHPDLLLTTMHDVSGTAFLLFVACRSAAWACVGAAAGLGMNLARATRAQLRNSVIGGALGGALGGMFFDPIDRWLAGSLFDGSAASRLVGLCAVGLSIGVFVALVERLARDAWLRVRTGPLAGKSFILYKTPTIVGSAPQADVYLYKDADIDAEHAAIHRVGTVYGLEDLGSRMGTTVGGAPCAGDGSPREIRSSSAARSSTSRSGSRRARANRRGDRARSKRKGSRDGGEASTEDEPEAAGPALRLVPRRARARRGRGGVYRVRAGAPPALLGRPRRLRRAGLREPPLRRPPPPSPPPRARRPAPPPPSRPA